MTIQLEKKNYVVDYGTGLYDQAESLDKAIEIAEANMTYTQKTITIEHNGLIVATSRWYGVAPEEDDNPIVAIGDWGFFAEWNYTEEVIYY